MTHKGKFPILPTQKRKFLSTQLQVADRGYVLETGQIIASGPASELMGDTLLSEAFLGGNARSHGD